MADVPYTANGLAKILADDFELGSRAEIHRVIRHYTNAGLLATEGEVHTGTGRKRTYHEDALLRAAILTRLNSLGIPVGSIKKLTNGLDQNVEERYGDELLPACRKIADPHLVLGIEPFDPALKLPQVLAARDLRKPVPGDVLILRLGDYLD